MSYESNTLPIGQVVALSGVPATTLRYYEKKGVVDPPPRVGGQRRYDPAVVMRLMVIRFCQSAGLTLDEIVAVLGDSSPTREITREIADRRIAAIEEQMKQLVLAKLMMESAVQCRCPSVESCECGAMEPAVEGLLASLA